MLKYSIPLSYVYIALQYRISKILILNSLSHLVLLKILSKFMAVINIRNCLLKEMDMKVIQHYVKSHLMVNQGLQDKKNIISAVFQLLSNFSKRSNF